MGRPPIRADGALHCAQGGTTVPRESGSRAIALFGALVVAASVAVGTAQQEPRFRGGTNLVRLDVYASVDGVAVTDLAAEDFEVFEDSAPQQVTSFELVHPRRTVPDAARAEPGTVAESLARASEPDARLFVLFLDTLHVQLDGSYRAQNPVAGLLDRVVGEDDLVGVMTPEMTARNMTFSPRTASIGRMLESNWAWGQRGRLATSDPREQQLEQCYPDMDATAGIAKALVERRREQATLRAIEGLVGHLEGVREERTFVLLLSEGWMLPSRDERLARALDGPGGGRQVPGPEPIGTTPDGRLAMGGRLDGVGMQSCERERSLLALADLEMEFRQLTQRANRANVSFYPIDPRGLVAFDEPIGPARPTSPAEDGRRLSSRQTSLRTLAAETDGAVVLNTDIERALPRLLTDVGSYYLLGYYSTNQKLDGRYRRLTVRVTRPGVSVRARPGYLAPSAQDLTAAPSEVAAPPTVVERALSRLPGARGVPPMYLQATGGAGYVQVAIELDRATVALAEWSQGASLEVEVGPAAPGAAERQVETVTLEPGKRVYVLRHPERDLLPAGRYQVRVQATPEGSRLPVTLSTVASVPEAGALLGSASLAARRGPGTRRLFEPTADPRFRRTERIVVETPLVAADATITARLLNRAGQPMALPVALSERLDASLQIRVSVAEISLAPLAPGEYVVEVTATRGAATEVVGYAIRIVP